MKVISIGVRWVLLALLVTGCAGPTYLIHYSLLEAPDATPPRKLVLLPLEISVSELKAAGPMEKDPDWSRQATEIVQEAVRDCSRDCSIELVPLPALTVDEQMELEQHLALFEVVGVSAFIHTTGLPALRWPSKREHFDYTLGSGLGFLAKKTGAEGALIILGEDYVSTAGRKVAFVFAAASGVAIPMGRSTLVAGIIDLRSGDILWLNRSDSEVMNLRDFSHVKRMVSELLQAYPGLEGYR